MKFGMIIPSYIYAPHREETAARSYQSLAGTDPVIGAPMAVEAVWVDELSRDLLSKLPSEKFSVLVERQPPHIHGLDNVVCWAMEQILANSDCTHIVWWMDDLVANPRWLLELQSLVERHPHALAWSVYRSAHTRHHNTIIQDGSGDHRVTALCGNGMCISREEWLAWGMKSTDGSVFPIPWNFNGGGDTLDLYHAYKRPGERWASDRTYIQHISDHGLHSHHLMTDCSLNFVGE